MQPCRNMLVASSAIPFMRRDVAFHFSVRVLFVGVSFHVDPICGVSKRQDLQAYDVEPWIAGCGRLVGDRRKEARRRVRVLASCCILVQALALVLFCQYIEPSCCLFGKRDCVSPSGSLGFR